MSLVPPAAPTRFDLILFVVGATLLTGGLAGVLSTIPLYAASAVSSLVASVALFDGMVRNPPTE
ncbi:hypothetical protein SAMN04487948_101378 [Halogranum amylolyticum]|uniref:Uncharacterized protein n=1 Tax=Halogranum amylolyticum TaxID=660520 RepID=A0A1H8N7X1_9EURY|nr:hypothetical protein [Halogranum amylolyticum]SEO25791.1 hypothetical protein SAMN04487948_101378 [Halogranum amylolyticum]